MKTRFTGILLAAAFLLGGCADLFGPSANPNPTAWKPPLPADVGFEPTVSSTRPLRGDDRVTVTVYAPVVDGITRTETIVNSAGYISLNMIGAIKIGGLTTAEAEVAVRDAYIKGGFYRKVDVNVVCPDMIQTLVVSVTGAVRKIGEIPFRDGMTLREAVISAGDVTEFANGDIILYRNNVATTYDLDRIKEGRDEDPLLKPRDILEARKSWR